MRLFPFGGQRRTTNADAVVTGAGSGIGAAFATELARRGGRVVCSDIDETAARVTADAIVAAGGEALATRCDVTRLDDVVQLAKEAQDWFGRPADPGGQQRRRRRRRNGHRRHRHR